MATPAPGTSAACIRCVTVASISVGEMVLPSKRLIAPGWAATSAADIRRIVGRTNDVRHDIGLVIIGELYGGSRLKVRAASSMLYKAVELYLIELCLALHLHLREGEDHAARR